jgi:predicted SnoaL-like aldol condensation-catalyzing enzyme
MVLQDHKKIVSEFFRLVAEGKPKEGLRFFAPDCRQHNPYVRGGMAALLDSMASVQDKEGPNPDTSFSIKHVLSDQDLVVVHTELLSSKSDPGQGGLRQAHIFRFGNANKIVEYWDLTQMVQPDMPNAANAF